MSKWEQSLEALESDDTLTVEQYEEWLDAGNGKFYNFHRDYLVATGNAEERERIIKLLEERYEGDEFVEEIIELIKGETNE